MKSYIQGLITGIILVASVVLFMSATDNSSDVGRYQIAVDTSNLKWMVDTASGNMYLWDSKSKSWHDIGGYFKQ